jgi:urease accessory protein
VVALNVKAPVAAAMALVGLFAIFHGHAHGAEMPLDASGLEYGIGFMAATALLHAIGIGGGALMGRAIGQTGTRLAGAAVSLAGVALLVQAFV